MDESTKISRRRLLLLAGGGIFVSILACGGVTALAIQPSAVSFGDSSCGEEDEMNKILIVYASRCGSTAEIANAIGAELCQRGKSVDIQHVEDVVDVSGYDAVVLGSAVRMGRWLPAAVKFAEEHGEELNQVPTACFTVHLEALDESEASRKQRVSYLDAVRPFLNTQDEAFFAGKLDFSRLNWFDRMISKMRGAQEVDLRDWQKVRAWADQLFQESADANHAPAQVSL